MSSERHSGSRSNSIDSIDELIPRFAGDGRRFLTLSVDLFAIAGFDYRFRWVNRAWERVLGHSREELLARTYLDFVHSDDRERTREAADAIAASEPGSVSDMRGFENRYRCRDGTYRWLLWSSTPDPAKRLLYAVAKDVTERKRLDEQLAHQALHDPLTGLPNRALALDRLGHALERSARTGGRVAVLFIDLDHFKVVNDSLGHQVGDELLIGVAGRLRRVLRASDTVARLGGDEYLMISEDLSGERDAVQMTERVLSALANPIELAGEEQIVTASIGVATADGAAQEADALIRDADAAMYRAKELGRSGYQLFDQTMRSRVVSRLETERALRRALREGELRLHYQPVVSLATGRPLETEALLRWERPGAGLVAAEEFMGVAEETGQVFQMGSWVLSEACRTASRWRREHGDRVPLPVYVNLPGRLLTSALPDLIAETLAENDLTARQMGVEITESEVMEGFEQHATVLASLRELGVKVRLDDFGTGRSSLSHVRRLPIDGFKIDRSFVAHLNGGVEDSAIVSTVAAMGKALGITVAAEGVETAQQAAAVRMLGCELGQGRHFGSPMPADALVEMLARTPSSAA